MMSGLRKATMLASALALTTLTLSSTTAHASVTREFIDSFGSSLKDPSGVAVDLETGNVYVREPQTEAIYVFGPNGGSPVDGVPSRIAVSNNGAGPGTESWGVAVDNSCYEHQPRLTGRACEEYDPSYGDVYAYVFGVGLEKFKLNPGHGYEPTGAVGPGNGDPSGVAIDSHGNAYLARTDEPNVLEFKKIVEKVVNEITEEEEIVEHQEEITIHQNIAPAVAYVAADALGDLYAAIEYEIDKGVPGHFGVAKLKIDASGNVSSEQVLTVPMTYDIYHPLAVDSSTAAVFLGDGSEIAEFSSAGALQLSFGSTAPLGGSLTNKNGGARAIAVNGETDRVYVANPAGEDVDVFGGVVGPAVVAAAQPPASEVTRTSALVAGAVSLESGMAEDYFQYASAGGYEPGAEDPYSNGGQTAIASLAGGHSPKTVERVALTGLVPGTLYHYRLVVRDAAGTTYGPDETFTTAPALPPEVTTGAASEVTATSATLAGVVGARGLPTSYVFEVGTDTGYEGARLFGNAGSSAGVLPVTVALRYLVPGTTYHYRLAATSFDGTSYGLDGTFRTPGVASVIAQPAGTPLIASPAEAFPSIAGATTYTAKGGKHGGKSSASARRRRALRVCAKQRSRRSRSRCQARARRAR